MAIQPSHTLLFCGIALILLARPTLAFGAGNIASLSKVEGVNWRHGDIEDVLLTIAAARSMSGRKFSKLDVKRVYFGNWLRDYSQAVDVGTVKYVSAEAIRILLWVLGFMTFGYGTGEFEVTTERLGCYRPEEHIDNPKDYADNVDARQYDRRLRGPVDERTELSIDPETGLKSYIASENRGIATSAGLVRDLFGRCIDLGRRYGQSRDKKDLYEALRLLGTGCHCLEDYAAHSNYVELALIELGERDVFPHVGRDTAVRLRGARNEVWPIVTGTFGGVDFLHSVCGEFDDKTTQSEIQELEGALSNAEQSDGSILRDLLSKIPSGLFGGKDEAGKVSELQQNAQAQQMQNVQISPRQPEEWTRYVQDVQKQIYPIIQWHDEVMQGLTETIEKLPILPELIENVQDEINKFVFSLLAPYLLPIIRQVQNELQTGSSEIIDSSKNQQHIVFNDDRSSDPTHSMLSKDHFSNVLNEPAGRVASATVKWVVPQLIQAWDDDRADVSRILDRIVHGVLHHPALRDQAGDASEGRQIMFGVVEKWWHSQGEDEKDTLRRQLSRDGVESGDNHKPGVHDHGHGSYRPEGQRFGIAGVTNGHGGGGNYAIDGAVGAIGNLVSGHADQNYNMSQQQTQSGIGQAASEAVGGGVFGSIMGGLASAVGVDMLGGGHGEPRRNEEPSYSSSGYGGNNRNDDQDYRRQQNNSYEESQSYGRSSYGQSRRQEEEQETSGYGRNEYSSRTEEYGSSEYSSERHESRHHQQSRYEARERREEYDQEESSYNTNRYAQREDESDSYNRRRNEDEGESYGRRRNDDEGESYGRRRNDDESESYGRRRNEDDDENRSYGRRHNDDDEQEESGGYGSRRSRGYGDEDNEDRGGYGEEQERGYDE